MRELDWLFPVVATGVDGVAGGREDVREFGGGDGGGRRRGREVGRRRRSGSVGGGAGEGGGGGAEEDGGGMGGDGERFTGGEGGEGGAGDAEGAAVVGVGGGEVVAGVDGVLHQAPAVLAPPHGVLVVQLRRRASHLPAERFFLLLVTRFQRFFFGGKNRDQL